MNASIEISRALYNKLRRHLLPKNAESEEAAFLFAAEEKSENPVSLRVADWYPVKKHQFTTRSLYHIELKDEVRAPVIKKAHDLNASVIEVHSHIGQKVAKFSPSDWLGFQEFVPHVRWRLKGKLYAAIVLTETSFDSLIWNDKTAPISPVIFEIEGRQLKPTSLSIKDVNDYYDEI